MSEELTDWASRLAREYRDTPRQVRQGIESEAERLARTLASGAPRRSGALARSFRAKGTDVTAALYARQVSDGGIVRARRHGFLTIPIRAGFVPSSSGFAVVGRPGAQVVVRSGTLEVWAARRREVFQRGSGFLRRGLAEHLEHAGDRLATVLPDVDGRP